MSTATSSPANLTSRTPARVPSRSPPEPSVDQPAIVVPAETGTPEFHDSAAPFLLVGELEDRSASEAVHVP